MKLKAIVEITFDTDDYVDEIDDIESQKNLVRDMLIGDTDMGDYVVKDVIPV